MDTTAIKRVEGTDLITHLPLPENKKFYPALDGLRAIAVLLVFHQHYLAYPLSMRWGWTGVDIFFVLSGFLITGILYDTRNTEHRFRNFYVRRTLRIFPLYYGLFFLFLVTTPIFHWVWDRAWYLWLFYLGNFAQIHLFDFLLRGQYPYPFDSFQPTRFLSPQVGFIVGHFWSLCIEEQFYLVWPFIVFFVKDRVRLRNFCAAVVILSPFLRLLCSYVLPARMLEAGFLMRFTPLRVDALLLGALVALCLRGPEAERVKRFGRPLALSLFTFFTVVTVGLVLLTHSTVKPESLPGIETFGLTLIDLLAAGIILLALNPHSLTYRLLNITWLRRLGQISYGFYVFHKLLHPFYIRLAVDIFGANKPHLNLFIAIFGLIGTTIISYLSFRFYESKFLLLKDRFSVNSKVGAPSY
jgi:peptidoglycan/LPS O-acetylase OafA/YrhL